MRTRKKLIGTPVYLKYQNGAFYKTAKGFLNGSFFSLKFVMQLKDQQQYWCVYLVGAGVVIKICKIILI